MGVDHFRALASQKQREKQVRLANREKKESEQEIQTAPGETRGGAGRKSDGLRSYYPISHQQVARIISKIHESLSASATCPPPNF